MTPISIVEPLGSSKSTCGYCSPPGKRSVKKSSHTTGLWPHQLSCDVYTKMIDRGWRRSGVYVYKPNLMKSCCPQYTIRLDALEFAPSKGQRKVLNKWNHWVLGTDPPSKPNKADPFSLIDAIHASEYDKAPKEAPHRFEVTLERSSYSKEKFDLYCTYQARVHNDKDKDPEGFKRFLVHSPLSVKPIEYSSPPPVHLPTHYGAYHQLYRVDGELAAIGVIDILPKCVSSVYLIYGEKWDWASLGKLSALREASLAREIHDHGVEDMKHLYMGFYIHSCSKMRYKGEYSPSYLLDPEDYTWHPLKDCTSALDKHQYVSFAHPDHSVRPVTSTGASALEPKSTSQQNSSDDEADDDEENSDAESDTYIYPEEALEFIAREDVQIISQMGRGVVYTESLSGSEKLTEMEFMRSFCPVLNGLGQELASKVLFYPSGL